MLARARVRPGEGAVRLPAYRWSKSLRRVLIAALLFQLLWIIGFLLFLLYPMVMTLYYSLTDYNILGTPQWVGLDNYRALLADDQFFLALGNTSYLTLIGVPSGLIFAFVTALLLNTKVKGMALWRTIYFLPAVMPPVAVSILWLWIFNPSYGVVNAVLGFLHVPQPGWFADPVWSKPAIILMGLWQVGATTIIYLAALQGVPQNLYEAVEIDGGGWWAKLRHVTIPIVSPVTLFNLITGVIGSFQFFTQAYVAAGGAAGAPEGSLLFFVMYIYQNAFQYFKMGYASALSWILFLIIMFCTIVLIWLSKRWTYYEAAAA
jgi:multiple sugar transport system permease protein